MLPFPVSTDSSSLGLTVLVVEDDAPTRSLLNAVVRRAGFATQFAVNGAEAIQMLQSDRYAVVVLDLMMPSVGGHDVIHFIAGNELNVPVVVCSAASPSLLTGFDDSIVKGVIRKPFDVEELILLLRRVATA